MPYPFVHDNLKKPVSFHWSDIVIDNYYGVFLNES